MMMTGAQALQKRRASAGTAEAAAPYTHNDDDDDKGGYRLAKVNGVSRGSAGSSPIFTLWKYW